SPVTFNLDTVWKTDEAGERYAVNYNMVVRDRETGSRKYKTLETANLREAERQLFAYEEKYRRGEYKPFEDQTPKLDPTFAEASAMSLLAKENEPEHLGGKLAKATMDQYRITLNRLERGLPPGALSRSVIKQDVIKILFRPHVKPNSI